MSEARKPKRKSLTKALQRKVFCEAGSKCPWCEVPLKSAEAEIHHIDGDRANNSFENLILVCRNHHGQIGELLIPLWEVQLKKTILCNPATVERLGLIPKPPTTRPPSPTAPKKSLTTPKPPRSMPPIVGRDNYGVAADTVNIDKAVFPGKKSDGRRDITQGLIEANPDMRTYATELVSRYIDWRKKGLPIENSKLVGRRAKPKKFSPGGAHTILGKDFGSQSSVLLIPQTRFFEWVAKTQATIDGTTFGRINRAKGNPNYHSWEVHLERRHGKAK